MTVGSRAAPLGPSAPQLIIEWLYPVRPKIFAPVVAYDSMISRLRGSALLNSQSCNRSPPSPNPAHPASGRAFAPVIKPSRDLLISKITFPIGLPPSYLNLRFTMLPARSGYPLPLAHLHCNAPVLVWRTVPGSVVALPATAQRPRSAAEWE